MEYLIYVSPPFTVVYTNGDVVIDIAYLMYMKDCKKRITEKILDLDWNTVGLLMMT